MRFMKFARTFAMLAFLLSANATNAGNATDDAFVADPKIQQIAEAYAQDAVDFSSKQFGIVLDWSDESLANVEKVLGKLSTSYSTANPKPNEATVTSFAKAYGSYIGEVFRRNHGATWGISSTGDQKLPSLRTHAGSIFWPWSRAYKRIVKGSEDNVADYYTVLLQIGTKQH